MTRLRLWLLAFFRLDLNAVCEMSRDPERRIKLLDELAKLEWEREPFMTPAEFATALKDIGITQIDCAFLMGVNARTVRRWCEEGPVSGPADTAMRAWLHAKAYDRLTFPLVDAHPITLVDAKRNGS